MSKCHISFYIEQTHSQLRKIHIILERRLHDVQRYLEKCPDGAIFSQKDAEKLQYQLDDIDSILGYTSKFCRLYEVECDEPLCFGPCIRQWEPLPYDIPLIQPDFQDRFDNAYAISANPFYNEDPNMISDVMDHIYDLRERLLDIMTQISEFDEHLVGIHENHAQEIFDIIAYRGNIVTTYGPNGIEHKFISES